MNPVQLLQHVGSPEQSARRDGAVKFSSMQYRLGRLSFVSESVDVLFDVPDGVLRHVVTINAELFVYAHEDERFGELLKRTVNTVDGRVVQWLCGIRSRHGLPKKVSGADFIYDLAARSARYGERLFLLGASPSSNRDAVRALRSFAPGALVEGFAPPVTRDVLDCEWNGTIMRRIREYQPRYLVVCFGPQRQEFWIDHNRQRLLDAGVAFAAGLGGSIDFVSDHIRRAPKLVQRAGLEWFYRFLQMPRARFRRTLTMFRLPWYALVEHTSDEKNTGDLA